MTLSLAVGAKPAPGSFIQLCTASGFASALNVFHSPVDPLATSQQGATQMRYGFYLPVVVAEVMVPAESRMNPKLRRQLRQGLLP